MTEFTLGGLFGLFVAFALNQILISSLRKELEKTREERNHLESELEQERQPKQGSNRGKTRTMWGDD